MCLQTVFSERKKRAFLKKQPDRIGGWKVVARPNRGFTLEYRSTGCLKNSWNIFKTNHITITYTHKEYKGGTHIFKWKKDARNWAGWRQYLVPITVFKKDITTVGFQGSDENRKLILVASKAKFNLSKAERV